MVGPRPSNLETRETPRNGAFGVSVVEPLGSAEPLEPPKTLWSIAPMRPPYKGLRRFWPSPGRSRRPPPPTAKRETHGATAPTWQLSLDFPCLKRIVSWDLSSVSQTTVDVPNDFGR